VREVFGKRGQKEGIGEQWRDMQVGNAVVIKEALDSNVLEEVASTALQNA